MSLKIERLESIFIKEISYILLNEVKDKSLKFVTITECKITSDLSYAKVYFRLLNDSDKETVLKSLKNASGFIRKKLAECVEVRHVPELQFIYDESIEYANKIENIIEKIHEDK